MSAHPVIAIDGPSGSGKGTISQLLARRLGWHFLDSGALYRLVALAARNHGVGIDNVAGLEVLAGHLDVQFTLDEEERIVLEGEDVTELIRHESISRLASTVAAMGPVRGALLERQRAFRRAPGLVADGRDMGTVVFPDAGLKIFLTASAEERADRRFRQLKAMGQAVSLPALLEDIRQRDRRDVQRSVSPLRPADDAVTLDSTDLSIDAVLQRVVDEASRRQLI